eukprot:IDg21971t1
MESHSSSGICMKKHKDTNFYYWRQIIELVLGNREVDEMINARLCLEKPPEGYEKLHKWLRKDKTARMTIGLAISDEMLKNVTHTSTDINM